MVLEAQPHKAYETNPMHKKKKGLFMGIVSGKSPNVLVGKEFDAAMTVLGLFAAQ